MATTVERVVVAWQRQEWEHPMDLCPPFRLRLLGSLLGLPWAVQPPPQPVGMDIQAVAAVHSAAAAEEVM